MVYDHDLTYFYVHISIIKHI